MRRVMLLPSALLALSACTPGGGAPPPLAAPFELQVGFSPGGLADTISITALDRLPLHAAERTRKPRARRARAAAATRSAAAHPSAARLTDQAVNS